MSSTVPQTLADDLDRARSDYLAVSRNAHLYSSPRDHEEAEARAWERLELALAAVQAAEQAAAAA